MDRKRKRCSADVYREEDLQHVKKKSKKSTVTEDAEVEMASNDIIAPMMPNNENPGQNNPRVYQARYGETVHGQLSGTRADIIVWSGNESAIGNLQSGNEPAQNIDNDENMNDGNTQIYVPEVVSNDLDIIDLTLDTDDDTNSYSTIATNIWPEDETNNGGSVRVPNLNMDIIDLTLDDDDDDLRSMSSIENYEENREIDETGIYEGISEEPVFSTQLRILIVGEQQQSITISVQLNNRNNNIN